MEKPLAKIILSEKEAALPFLTVLSKYILAGSVSVSDAEALIGKYQLESLVISGAVEIDGESLVFENESGWLYAPSREKPKKPEKSNFDKQIERIANIVGVPIDLFSNMGKYRALYSKLRNKGYSFDYIETIAYDNEGIGLNKLFTESVFESCVRKFENARR